MGATQVRAAAIRCGGSHHRGVPVLGYGVCHQGGANITIFKQGHSLFPTYLMAKAV